MIQSTNQYLTSNQIELLLSMVDSRGQQLRDEYAVVLKSRHCGMNTVNLLISAMEENKQLFETLTRIKKEV